MIEEHFASIPNGPDVPQMYAVEPPQRGERRIVLEGDGFVPYLQIAFRAPAVHEPDFFALTVLGAALTGARGMTFMGGASTNKSSRLYKALVKTEIAAAISGSLVPTIDPFVYNLSVVVRPGHTPAEAEQVLKEELERIASSPITEEEVNKAIKQAKAQFAYSSESVTSQALWAGFSEMFADYEWFERYIENLSAVTVEDVQRVAQEYLHPSRRTVGWYIPNKA